MAGSSLEMKKLINLQEGRKRKHFFTPFQLHHLLFSTCLATLSGRWNNWSSLRIWKKFAINFKRESFAIQVSLLSEPFRNNKTTGKESWELRRVEWEKRIMFSTGINYPFLHFPLFCPRRTFFHHHFHKKEKEEWMDKKRKRNPF